MITAAFQIRCKRRSRLRRVALLRQVFSCARCCSATGPRRPPRSLRLSLIQAFCISRIHSKQSIYPFFSKGEYVLPGTYRVDVYVNQNFVEQREVQFIAPAPDASAKPCIRRALLEAAGVLLNVFPALNAAEETQCLDVESAVENAQVAFDLGQQRLNLSIPQIALRQVARGGVDPKEWDTGAA